MRLSSGGFVQVCLYMFAFKMLCNTNPRQYSLYIYFYLLYSANFALFWMHLTGKTCSTKQFPLTHKCFSFILAISQLLFNSTLFILRTLQ